MVFVGLLKPYLICCRPFEAYLVAANGVRFNAAAGVIAASVLLTFAAVRRLHLERLREFE
jgi:hypothetical protein